MINELELLRPSGDPDVDEAWRSGIQTRFAATIAEQRSKKQLLTALTRHKQASAPADVDLLDMLPQGRIDLARLPEEQQRRIYDAFQLELRYNAHRREVTIRVTITADTAPTLAATIKAITGAHPVAQVPGPEPVASKPGEVVADALRAPGRIRTCDTRLPTSTIPSL